jgi:membrane associated rhomboid family serine protease
MGAKQGYLIQKGAVWRFVTPMLLHAGIIHLLANLICQWRTGLFLERRWGTLKYAAVYIASGIGGTLLSCLWKPNGISVGASGALSGLMGAFLADVLLNWNNIQATQRKVLLAQAIFWALISLMLGLFPYIDGAAHLGGLLVGFAVGVIVMSNLPKTQLYRILAMTVPAVILSIYFLVGIICFWTVVKCTPFLL